MNRPEVSLLKGTSIVSALTLVSRVFGLLRDLLIARYLGAGWRTDAFFVAFRIPNLLRSLVAEGALTSAFVPVFSSELKEKKEQAYATFQTIANLLLLTTFFLTLAGIFFAPGIISILAPGFNENPEQRSLCITLTQIMFPYIIFVSIVSLCNGALNSVGIFGAAPVAQIIMNGVLIAGAFSLPLFDSLGRVYVLSFVVVAGGAIQIVSQLPFLKKASLPRRPGRKFWTPAARDVGLLMLPAVGGAAVYQMSLFFNTILASVLQEGSVSWLFYADRVAQLPIGLFTVALTSVLLPSLSHAASGNKTEAFKEQFLNSLRFTSFLLIPVSTGLLVYSEELVALFFERGEFSAYSRVQTAHAVQAMCFGIWGISCYALTMRTFIARKNTLTPTLLSIANVCIGLVAALWLMGKPVRLEKESWINWLFDFQSVLLSYLPAYDLAHSGLAIATGLGSMISFPFTLMILQRDGVSLPLSGFINSVWKALFGSVAMYLVLTELLPDLPFVWMTVVAGTLTGAAVYALSCILLKNQEWLEMLQTITRIRSRRKN